MPDRTRDFLPSRVEQRMQADRNVKQRLEQALTDAAPVPLTDKPFLTLSRQYGCEAVALAEQVTAALTPETGSEWHVYSRQIIDDLAQEMHLSPALLQALDRTARGGMQEFFETLLGRSAPDITILRHLVSTVRALALVGRAVIVGRGGAILTGDLKGGVHVRLIAPEEWRLARLVTRFGWTREKALATLREEEQHRLSFYEKYLGRDGNAPENYDLVLNVARTGRAEQVETVLALCRSRFAALKEGAA